MKNKLKYLTKISLNKKIKSKWFFIANIFLLILIVGLMNIDSIIKFFGGDFENITEILVINNTEYDIFEDIKINYDNSSKIINNEENNNFILFKDNLDKAKEKIKENDGIILVIENDTNNFINASIITNDDIDPITFQILNTSLNSIKTDLALNYYEIDKNMLNAIESPIKIEKISLNNDKNNDEMKDLIMGIIFPVMILPFFMLTIFLVQMIGAEINEEKTTRGMEIIISNVSPRIHFFSKIIASNLFVLIQGGLLVLDVVIALIIKKYIGNNSLSYLFGGLSITEIIKNLNEMGILDKLIYIIPLTLILMILTFIAYSLLAGILASMTTNMEDYQQLQTPIIIISLAGYYLSIMAAMFEGSLFIKILAYLPFISSLLAPSLLILGQIQLIDFTISVIILILTIYVLYKYGLKIYKVGILNYSSTGLWKKMFKAIKEK